jgi:hypothetical protein
MIEGLAWMAVANAGLLLATHAIHRRVATEHRSLNGVLFILIHLLLMSSSVLVAGVSGCLTPRALGLSGAAVLGLLLLLREHRTVRLPARLEIGRATAVLAVMIGVRMLLQVWFLCPINGDAVSYHLPKVAEWVRSGAFTREMGVDFCAPFPAGFELIETWWVVFLHHDVLIEMAGVEFAILAFLAVRLLGEGLGLSPKAACLASTLYVLTPTFNLQAISSVNDAPVAALVLSIAALTLHRAHVLLLALPLGLLLGTKATGLYTMPGWFLLAFFNRKQPWLRPGALRAALLVAGTAAAVGVFWYLRNYIWYGSPVHPLRSGDLTYYERLFYIQMGPNLNSLRYNVSEFVTNLIYDDRFGLSPMGTAGAGWGIVPFSVGALALILEIRRDPAFRRAAAAFGVSICFVLLMVKPDAWVARFILFAPALPCIAAARLSESVRPVALLLALGAAFEFTGTLLPQERPTGVMIALMRRPWRERSADALYKLTPPGDPLAVYATLRSKTYLMYGPDFSRRVLYLRVAGPEELAAEMERRGVRFVYVNILRRVQYDFEELVRKGRFRDLGEGYFALP